MAFGVPLDAMELKSVKTPGIVARLHVKGVI
jgi:hypothetical protein